MNIALAAQILNQLKQIGVDEVCICAGARNSPLVVLLDENKEAFQSFHFFDERSASFFAIGRSKLTQRPTVIITTSGTAVAELVPAAVESFYSQIPLIFLTADRPRSFRNSGAPQTIIQPGIFSHYTELNFDIESADEPINLETWSKLKSIHINLCFNEPLIDGEVPKLATAPPFQGQVSSPAEKTTTWNIEDPLIIVSELEAEERPLVRDFLLKNQIPFYAEALSGLQGDSQLKELQILNGEILFNKSMVSDYFSSVLRIGRVPTLRLWRDLEIDLLKLPVYSVCKNPFTGASRPVVHSQDLAQLLKINLKIKPSIRELISIDRQASEFLTRLYKEYPKAEASLVNKYSQLVKGERLYLGNSLPIREWDRYASQISLQDVFGNRGANGIDGQLSTFLGWCDSSSKNWSLFGDLTTLYDLSAPWISRQLESEKIAIGIMNNFGGQIFNRMFGRSIFLNQHDIHFEKWAQMWGWKYELWSHVPNQWELNSRTIIELRPDQKESTDFQLAMDQIALNLWS